MNKVASKINLSPFSCGISALLFIFYGIFFWDYHVSKYLFKQYCEEEGRVGLFIYEKVALSDEYFMSFPKDTDPRDLDRRFIVGENLMINRERFEQDFIFEIYKQKPLSNIGPIVSIETSITRKYDNKILSKTVSIKNRKGWFSKAASFGYGYEKCPSSKRESGLVESEFTKLHEQIVKKTFNLETYQ